MISIIIIILWAFICNAMATKYFIFLHHYYIPVAEEESNNDEDDRVSRGPFAIF